MGEIQTTNYPKDFLRRYEVIQCLGQSETSETLLIKEKQTDDLCVAKCCHESSSFVSTTGERELTKDLNHSGLAQYIRSYIGINGELIIVREYVPGKPLDEWVGGKCLSRKQIIDICLQLCDILSYLHEHNPPIIHRDIKPQNIIMMDDGRIKLIDFGIARFYKKEQAKDTIFMGTQEFASPEQYGFAQTDGRSDIYSLGILLNWLFTGETDTEKFRCNDRDVTRIIRKCTAFSPQQRYHTVRMVKWALLLTKWKLKQICAGTIVLTSIFVGGILAGKMMNKDGALPDSKIAQDIQEAQESPSISGLVEFQEPLIEQAVRLQLGKQADEVITSQELQSVEGIFINRDRCFLDAQACFAINEELPDYKGPITSLVDLAYLPNLQILFAVNQQITDLTPVSQLRYLHHLELSSNPVGDLTPIKGLIRLSCIGLGNDNLITDISPLMGLPILESLAIVGVSDYEPTSIAGLPGRMVHLNISNGPDSYKYLGEREIVSLDVQNTSIDTLDYLKDVTNLEELRISWTRIDSLKGIEIHAQLKELWISGLYLDDLSPLLNLPHLEKVYVSSDMEGLVEEIEDEAKFEIEYTDKSQTDTVEFQEPLIEQAVRLQLGKQADEVITSEELKNVEGIFINHERCYLDSKACYEDWGIAPDVIGSITSLTDLKYLPNLQCLFVANQQIIDITPVSQLKYLRQLELAGNQVQDITPIKGLIRLTYAGLASNYQVTDISPLLGLPVLDSVSLIDISDYEPASIGGLSGRIIYLNISNDSGSYQYLGERQIITLDVTNTSIDTLDFLMGVKDLEELRISWTRLDSLAGIETHTQLKVLWISGLYLDDLSPLLNLPHLEKVYVSSDMEGLVEEIEDEAKFEIEYAN